MMDDTGIVLRRVVIRQNRNDGCNDGLEHGRGCLLKQNCGDRIDIAGGGTPEQFSWWSWAFLPFLL
mgnify:FL=1|jgi:hypothetical protein